MKKGPAFVIPHDSDTPASASEESDGPSTPPKASSMPPTPPMEGSDSAAEAVTPPLPGVEFQVWDNVYAKVKGKWYLAQVFKVERSASGEVSKYHLYFLDGEEKVFKPSLVRAEATPTPTRDTFISSQFYFDGAEDLASGNFKVRRIKRNLYICCRMTGGDGNMNNLEEFDIGYVMREVQKANQRAREVGPPTRRYKRRYRGSANGPPIQVYRGAGRGPYTRTRRVRGGKKGPWEPV